jgi:hypothetical protein
MGIIQLIHRDNKKFFYFNNIKHKPNTNFCKSIQKLPPSKPPSKPVKIDLKLNSSQTLTKYEIRRTHKNKIDTTHTHSHKRVNFITKGLPLSEVIASDDFLMFKLNHENKHRRHTLR